MSFDHLFDNAWQILEDEGNEPTLTYSPSVADSNMYVAATLLLTFERQNSPRRVHENPNEFTVSCVNLTLLQKVFQQIPTAERPSFVDALLAFVSQIIPARPTKAVSFPIFENHTSELALLAEFLIRTGYLESLFAAIDRVERPARSIVIILIEIGEMIALNFNLFSKAELDSFASRLGQLREIAGRQTWSARRDMNTNKTIYNPHYKPGSESVGQAVVDAIDEIVRRSKKASYFYLKGALQDLPNLEIERDKLTVENYLVKLGFNPTLVSSLNAVESDYKSSNPFELKNSLGHLRSFLEHLHRDAVRGIAAVAGDSIPDKWGDAILFLRAKAVFSAPQEKFVASLYTLLSDESVHPLTTEREYARLLRNVVIEWGVLFLTALEKAGHTSKP